MNNIREILAEDYGEDLLFADGFDEAIVGVVRQFSETLVCYNTNDCIRILQERGMSHEEAVEFFEFNVVGSYVGPKTPCFLSHIEQSFDRYIHFDLNGSLCNHAGTTTLAASSVDCPLCLMALEGYEKPPVAF